MTRAKVQTGLDLAAGWLGGASVPAAHRETARLLKGGRLGLITNPSAVSRSLDAAPDLLIKSGAALKALFGPEHGVRGDIADGVPIPHGRDEHTGLPVWSLYGAASAPSTEMLRGLDALLFDIQDVGARFYTFASTLSKAMDSAEKAGIPIILLDRPNPIGGLQIEGPILEPAHASFVGLHPIPIRHAATMGEIGRIWAGFGSRAAPVVVECRGWRRRQYWDETDLAWVAPSPNMPAVETALVYPGLCLLEGTNVSEGRGTTMPFLYFGAPWIKPESLAARLNEEKIPGALFRPVRFRPLTSKHSGIPCQGCQIHVRDRQEFRPVAAGVAILTLLRREYPKEFQWRRAGDRYAVDRLAGASAVREAIEAGTGWREISASWTAGERDYRRRLREIELYE